MCFITAAAQATPVYYAPQAAASPEVTETYYAPDVTSTYYAPAATPYVAPAQLYSPVVYSGIATWFTRSCLVSLLVLLTLKWKLTTF